MLVESAHVQAGCRVGGRAVRGRRRLLEGTMRKRMAIAGGVAAAVGGYVAASAIVYDRLTRVPGGCPPSLMRNTPEWFSVPNPPEFDASPWFMPAPEAVSFPSRDEKITISGWYIAADDPNAPAVIVVHGHMA